MIRHPLRPQPQRAAAPRPCLSRRSSRTIWRGRAAGGSCCGSRISTARAAGPELARAVPRRPRLARPDVGRGRPAPVDAAGQLRRGGRAAAGDGPALPVPSAPAPKLPPQAAAIGSGRAGLSGHLPRCAAPTRKAPPGGSTWPRRWRSTGPLTWDRRACRAAARARPNSPATSVLLRKDAPASYHLAATLDDAADGITLVTRGATCSPRRHVHRLLQALLGLPVPRLAPSSAAARARRPQARQAPRLAVAGRPAARGRGRACARRDSARTGVCPLAFRSRQFA